LLRASRRNWPSVAYLVALVALVALPLVLVASILVDHQAGDVAATDRKAVGVMFQLRLNAAVAKLQALRAGVVLRGSVRLNDRLAVERALTQLYDYNAGAGRVLYLAKPLERLDTAWRSTPEAGSVLPQVGATLLKASDLAAAIDERSALKSETDEVSAYLVDAFDVQLPIIEDRSDQQRLLALGAARNGRKPGTVRLGVEILAAQANRAYQKTLTDVTRAEAVDGATATASHAVGLVEPALHGFAGAAYAGVPPATVLRSSDAVFSAVDAASLAVASQASRIFSGRLAYQRNLLRWLRVAALAAGAVALAVGFLLARSFQRTSRREIARVREEAQRLKTLRENDRMRELLALTEARFEAVFDRASIGVAILDREGKIVRRNATLERMLPAASPAELGAAHPDFERVVVGDLDSFSVDLTATNGDRSYAYETVVSLVRDDAGAPLFAVALVQDVTERRESDERLRYEATHDELVQLPNRSYLVDRMETLVGEQRPEGFAGVAFVDMDDFKSINDTLGHEVGDRVLIDAARRLRSAIDAGDFVARFGGDEFVVLLAARAERGDTIAATDRIVRALSAPYQIDGREIFVTISAGLAIVDRPYRTVDDLLRDADTAMYHAKAAGRSRYAVFDPSMRDRATRRRVLGNQLRRALEREQFYLVFQPVVSLATEDVESFEVLLRWEHPELGLVPPDEFVPVLEEIGLIVPVGRWVLERACSQLARWKAEFSMFDATYLGVNASVREVLQLDYCEFVERTLERHGLRSGDLVLEVTETVVLQSDRFADNMLRRLKRAGVGLAIDDFGTGFSSLRYLHDFPFDHLKIDASFVRGADGNLASEPIVEMLIALGKSFGVNVVAEGVETREQAMRLRALGCAAAQGFFFGGAVAPSVVPALLDRGAQSVAG